MPDAATISSGVSRLAPTTATSVIAKRGDVSSQPTAPAPAPSTASDTAIGTMRVATHARAPTQPAREPHARHPLPGHRATLLREILDAAVDAGRGGEYGRATRHRGDARPQPLAERSGSRARA